MGDVRHISEAAARDDQQCPACYDTGAVCERCMRRYELQVRQRRAPSLTGAERFGLALLAVLVVFLAAVFTDNREIASVAAYAVMYGGGAFAVWSLVSTLRGADPW